ncbi:MAG: hypothetical protein P0Y51_26960 [Candidatus Pseudomonas colombiensis]|jgi:hypothetical protein|nr:MAG: hypothetical protein P0Y51_26960 [Pseudomonas sp.]
MPLLTKSLLALALLSGLLSFVLPQASTGNVPLIACGVFFSLFVLALMIGRRIKFDPVLR